MVTKDDVSAPRILLLMATRTYRSRAFMNAARRLGVDVVVGSERRQALASRARGTTLALDFARPERAIGRVVAAAAERPFAAVVGVDDDTTTLAALASEALGLAHNSPASVRASRDKHATRRVLADAGLPSPTFATIPLQADPTEAARGVPYPCVLKPVGLSASRGVIRADDPEAFVAAFRRIAAMLRTDEVAASDAILVESFIPGFEVALEGLLTDGALRVLALFDKPDPLDGPFFEETLYITPSRLPVERQEQVSATTTAAAAALGLRHGPIHAELRLGPGGPFVVEVAARSIGGLCSNTLRFGTGLSLEEVILGHAVGRDVAPPARERAASGVMMLPIPRAGTLLAVRRREEALRVPGIHDLEVTIPLGQPVVPLPEGDRYLGFLFARARTPEEVEAALREAHSRLGFVIGDPDDREAPCLQAMPHRLKLPMLARTPA